MTIIPIIALTAIVIVELLSIGYYFMAKNPVPFRPWWYRICGFLIEVSAIVMAIYLLAT